MVRATQLIGARLEGVKNLLVELDVQLLCERLLDRTALGDNGCAKAVDEPGARKSVVGQGSCRGDPLDASQEAGRQAQRKLCVLRPGDQRWRLRQCFPRR